ncbi:MAG: aspartate kinase [Bacillota bacterium]
MKVAKFGGTSLANAEQIKKVCEIVVADSDRRIIVVSAPGKRDCEDVKVTDLLIRLAEKILNEEKSEMELEAVLKRFNEIIEDLGLGEESKSEIYNDILNRTQLSIAHAGKFMDCMKAAGEDNAAKITASYLKKIGYEASYVNPKDAGMFLSDDFGNARVLPQSYDLLEKLNERTGILIFPGFFGYTLKGEVATFPRGGSDISGSILAAAVKADVYENFTDVDSVFAANPKLIKDPQPIPVFTYEEMRELSYAGFSVLHEETLEPVYKRGIVVNIKNTNNPEAPGTLIVKSRDKTGNPVVGIAIDKGFVNISVSKYMMNREVGFGRKLLQILEEEGISYDHTPSGIDNMSIIMREAQISGKEERILGRIKAELDVDKCYIEYDKALVMVVGEGMIHAVGVAMRATAALAHANVNIEMINQGSSEVSLMFGVKAADAENALRALYKEFFGGKNG